MAFDTGTRIGPYEILELLGAGGMGEVYKARDTRLHRVIALKALPVEKMAEAERKSRFLAEAQAASRLNHPNIVTIYDIPEQDGVCFIAMEYLTGCTLERVNAASEMSIATALGYADEIAAALTAAHSAGIIHRDLKLANIMITGDGRVKLLDFGLAKFTRPEMDGGDTATLRTQPGTVMGTAAYMSPEQASGQEIDARSDVFSFGLVVYEMLCGQRAFRGDSWIATLAAILHAEPAPPREINPAVPLFAEQIVLRCLCKDPRQRFQTMADVQQALRRPPAAAPAEAREETQSIAVLPFENLSTDKENAYFSDGLAEEIINALARVPELRVIARTSAFAFRGRQQDLRAIGERLRVRTVLEGSVRRAGDRIRVTAQLIQVSDESQLWSERYDRQMTDIFAIQDEISQAISNALKVRFTVPQQRAGNIEAYQSYLKGLYWYQRYNAESLAKAKESFEQALLQDPNYAPAHAGLAVFYFGIGALSLRSMTEMAPQAKAAAQKALTLDPTLSEAHSVIGLVTGAVEYDWKSAEQHFQAAMAVRPVPSLVRVRYALYFLIPQRRFDEALAQFQLALPTDPLSMMVHFGLTFALYCKRRCEEAIAHGAKMVELYPDYWLVHFALGLAYGQAGDDQRAVRSLENALKLSPLYALATGFLAAACVRSGQVDYAEKLMSEVRQRNSMHYVSSASFAVYHAALGQREKMFEFLEAAFLERDPSLTRMDAEPVFDAFRTDPRYRGLLAKMNLA